MALLRMYRALLRMYFVDILICELARHGRLLLRG